MPEKKVRFAEFELDFGRFQLSRGGSPVRLEGLPLQLLMYLVEHHRQLVTREQIASELWGKDVFVDIEQGINTASPKNSHRAGGRFGAATVSANRGGARLPVRAGHSRRGRGDVASSDGTQAFKISAEEFGKALMAAAGLDDPKTPPKVPNNS